MIQFLNSWASGLIIAVIIGTILEMILPDNTNKKYVKVVIGIFILFTIISPIISKFGNGINLNAESLEKYMTPSKETYIEVPTNATFITNDETIKKLYISNLENEIKAGIENLNYTVTSIKIGLENDTTYGNISEIVLNAEPKNKVEIVEKINVGRGLCLPPTQTPSATWAGMETRPYRVTQKKKVNYHKQTLKQ